MIGDDRLFRVTLPARAIRFATARGGPFVYHILELGTVRAPIAGAWWEWKYATAPLILRGQRFDAYSDPRKVVMPP